MNVIEVIFPAVLAFIIERVWDYYAGKKEIKQSFEKLKNQAIVEINYNLVSGVGYPACHFKFDAHIKLAEHVSLNEEIRASIIKIVNAGSLCNSYGGMWALTINSGGVKAMSRELLNMLSGKKMAIAEK